MADFMGDDIGLREIAGRAEARRQFLEELEVEIDLLVERAIERSHRRLSGAALRSRGLFVEHERRRAVALDFGGPHIGR